MSLSPPYTASGASGLHEDMLQRLFSHLDAPRSAKAALVCRRWYHTATPVAYAHIFLHAGSWTSASALSRTLLRCAHLRRHVEHLTVIHCARYFPRMGNSLYGWLSHVPEGSLRSCRAIGGAALVGTLLASPAVRTAPRLAVLTLFYKVSDYAVPHVEVLRCGPQHMLLADRERNPRSSCGFLQCLFPHFRVKWGHGARSTLYLSLATPAAAGGVALSGLGGFLVSFSEHLARANFVVLTLGYTSRPLPTGRELCEEGLAGVTRRPSRCQCSSMSEPGSEAPNRFAAQVSSGASVVCAAFVGGEPFSVETARLMLECADSARRDPRTSLVAPVRAHVAILRVAGVPHGQVCGVCGIQLYAVFRPSFDVKT